MQLLRFTYFTKQSRKLTLMDRTLPLFDYGYQYDLTVSENLLLKLPAQLEINSLTIVGPKQQIKLDTATCRMLVVETLDHLSKMSNNYITSCTKLTTVDLSSHWEIILQIVCQKLVTLDIKS
jgi:hypothetical protein